MREDTIDTVEAVCEKGRSSQSTEINRFSGLTAKCNSENYFDDIYHSCDLPA